MGSGLKDEESALKAKMLAIVEKVSKMERKIEQMTSKLRQEGYTEEQIKDAVRKEMEELNLLKQEDILLKHTIKSIQEKVKRSNELNGLQEEEFLLKRKA